ncbi:hypothetical protein [Halogranum rubrum]|uniref:hypothetical protein n=1 Tax=Halogranum rubrum TaxID=553466 RepID=UPI0012F71A02|nr:hypothetical protein [Halogranum salarium]
MGVRDTVTVRVGVQWIQRVVLVLETVEQPVVVRISVERCRSGLKFEGGRQSIVVEILDAVDDVVARLIGFRHLGVAVGDDRVCEHRVDLVLVREVVVVRVGIEWERPILLLANVHERLVVGVFLPVWESVTIGVCKQRFDSVEAVLESVSQFVIVSVDVEWVGSKILFDVRAERFTVKVLHAVVDTVVGLGALRDRRIAVGIDWNRPRRSNFVGVGEFVVVCVGVGWNRPVALFVNVDECLTVRVFDSVCRTITVGVSGRWVNRLETIFEGVRELVVVGVDVERVRRDVLFECRFEGVVVEILCTIKDAVCRLVRTRPLRVAVCEGGDGLRRVHLVAVEESVVVRVRVVWVRAKRLFTDVGESLRLVVVGTVGRPITVGVADCRIEVRIIEFEPVSELVVVCVRVERIDLVQVLDVRRHVIVVEVFEPVDDSVVCFVRVSVRGITVDGERVGSRHRLLVVVGE